MRFGSSRGQRFNKRRQALDIRVSGHQVDTGEALQTHVETRLGSISEKYFSKALSSHATFGRAPHDGFTSDIVMHVMQGLVLKGRGEAQDACIDRAGRTNRKAAAAVHAQVTGSARADACTGARGSCHTVFDAGGDEEIPLPTA